MPLRKTRTFAVFLVAFALVTGGSWALAGTLSPSAATTQTTIDSCTTIDEPGTYVLTGDVENGGGTAISRACIVITADDVTLDGNEHQIDGRGVSHTKGVAVFGARNVTVTNLAVNDWHAGVLVENGSATVRNVRSFSNAYGVRLENAPESRVINNTIEDNLIGVYVGSGNVQMANNTLSGNEIGVKRADASSS